MAPDSTGRLCSINGLGNYQCPSGEYCGNPEQFPWYDASAEFMDSRQEINFGITNFDNIGTSLLTVFEVITADTWYQ